MDSFKKMQYYAKRGGIGNALAVTLKKAGLLSNENYRALKCSKKFERYFQQLKPERYLEELKEQIFLFVENGREYNIEQPRTFNEKIQWLKIYDNLPIKAELSDKYAVRKWIKEKIGEQYLVPLVGGPWEKGEEIDFDLLPERFVLKANHGSGMNVIVKDKRKLDIPKTVKTVNGWMDTLFGWNGMETQYFTIPRRIIAEEYIEQSDGNLLDYKIYCHNGKPLYFQMIGNRDFETHSGRLAFFDLDWNLQDFNTGDYPDYEYLLDKPENLRELIQIAEVLAEGFKFVRVDLYEINGEVKFGEMTFTPGNGFLPWKPKEANERMGNLLDI